MAPIGPVLLHSGDILTNGLLNTSTFFRSLKLDYKLHSFLFYFLQLCSITFWYCQPIYQPYHGWWREWKIKFILDRPREGLSLSLSFIFLVSKPLYEGSSQLCPEADIVWIPLTLIPAFSSFLSSQFLLHLLSLESLVSSNPTRQELQKGLLHF